VDTERFAEIFAVEIDGWCYGLANFPGEVYPELVHRVIKELADSFRLAIDHGVAFDVIELASKFAKSAKFVVTEKEATYSILAQLPNPAVLNEDGQYTLAAIVDKVDQVFEGTLEKLQNRWRVERKVAA